MDKTLNNACFDDILRILTQSRDDLVVSGNEIDEAGHLMRIYTWEGESSYYRTDADWSFNEFYFDWDVRKKTLSEQKKDVRVKIHHYFENNDLLKYL